MAHSLTQILKCGLLLIVCTLGAIPTQRVLAQLKPAGSATSPLCRRDNALMMIKQQVDLSNTLNSAVRRIDVLVRAADLLWPYENEKARTVFADAFELAVENEKAKEAEAPRSAAVRMQSPDQRYFVIRAVAKRDPAWAIKLMQQVIRLDTDDVTGPSNRDSLNNVLTGQRLLDSAHQLVSTDSNAALDLASASLNYPASFMLTRFLYRLAEVNQQAADQFYGHALSSYGDKPMREFLYLQAYPFGLSDSPDTPEFASYVVPINFVTNRSLQSRFVQVLLRRAQQVLEVPLDEADTYRNIYGTHTPGEVHLLQALMRTESQVRNTFPDFLAPLAQARENILVSLSVETQKTLLQPGREISTKPKQTFDEQIELAQKQSNVNDRDELIVMAVLSDASDKQGLANVIQAIDKITNSNLRVSLLEWLYFRRAATAVKDKQFEEAERLASRVDGQTERAYLHTEIAKALLNKRESQTHARELLDEAITEANKAGKTIFTARTLLTVANLYAKIDLGRAMSVLTNAINFINHIDAPDFSADDQTLVQTIGRKGKPGNYLLRSYMPGLDPERAFREMAKLDFDSTLYQSGALTDKFQRAISTLSLAGLCLQQAQNSREKPIKSTKP